jgi:hypothetical protein
MYESHQEAVIAVRKGFTKTFVPLSKEGVDYVRIDHDSVITGCPQCFQVTPGWELVFLSRNKGTAGVARRMHCVVESKAA